MEPRNQQNDQENNQKRTASHKSPASRMALLSLFFGLIGVVFCLSPLVQLPLGIAAVTLSYRARQNGVRNMQAALGMVFGILAIILSLIIFGSIIYVYQVLLNDPALGPVYNDMYRQIMSYWGQMAS